MSWNPLAARDLERERLEGSLLTVCTECKDMVVQVLGHTNKLYQYLELQLMIMNKAECIFNYH